MKTCNIFNCPEYISEVFFLKAVPEFCENDIEQVHWDSLPKSFSNSPWKRIIIHIAVWSNYQNVEVLASLILSKAGIFLTC